MGKRDFSDLEDQIKDTLKNTFDAIDFARIKDDINNKTESTLNEVKTNLKNKSQHFNEKIKNKGYYKFRNITDVTSKDKNEVQMYISKRPAGSISGILYMIFGFIGCAAFGSMLTIYSIFTSFLIAFSEANFITLGILFSFCILHGLSFKRCAFKKKSKAF
ncbi:hypothetical protein [Clostridium sp. OS1-26]|uniref:hypothetical protein n=1 Tax=Clostridium sp. OS1-26 TaxID=3070681 RepID=UPI0027DFB78D|nr:hypothetical protein [Clostridium sp. OS1-26]WML34456.1 hypothetical protein RCG18_24750 [Clostridium sp. OS1-26]